MKRKLLWALLVALVGVAAYAGTVLATPPSGVTNPPWSPVIGRFDNGIDSKVKTNLNPGAATDSGKSHDDSDDDGGNFWRSRISIRGATDVHILENIIAPGGTFGWHSHPGPSLVIVRAGTLSVYHGPDCTPQDFGPGSALGSTFVDDGHDLHMVRNNGTVTADVYVVSFVPAGFQRRIDEPNPNPAVCPN